MATYIYKISIPDDIEDATNARFERLNIPASFGDILHDTVQKCRKILRADIDGRVTMEFYDVEN